MTIHFKNDFFLCVCGEGGGEGGYLSANFEPSQSQGGAKTGDPREKPPDHLQAELGLFHM